MKAATRKPTHLLATAGSPRQRIWETIRRIGTGFSTVMIREATGLHIETVRNYLHCLEAGGVIAQMPEGKRPKPYFLVRDTGFEAPRLDPRGQPVTIGLGRENMWRAMRITREFTALELAASASTEEVKVDVEHANQYCRDLAKAGYLAVIEKGAGRRGRHTRWQFVQARWTGPYPPVVERLDIVWDANLREIVWHGEPRE